MKTCWVKVMFGYSVEFGKMRLGGSNVLGRSFVVRQCFGILLETSSAQKRLFFEASGDLESFARQDYLILRERISDKESWGGSLCGTGFGKILNLGFGLNRLPVSGGFLVVRVKGTF